jgi:hypothetical protein
MPFTVKPTGEIVADTVDEAIALADAIQRRKPPASKWPGAATLSTSSVPAVAKPIVAAMNGHVVRRPFVPKSAAPLIKLLEGINKAPEHRILAQELAKIMKLSEAKGLGGYQAMANAILPNIGFKTVDVFLRTYDANGKSIWAAGPQIDRAIETLKAKERRPAEHAARA